MNTPWFIPYPLADEMIRNFADRAQYEQPCDIECRLHLTWLVSPPHNGLTTVFRRIPASQAVASPCQNVFYGDNGMHTLQGVLYIASPPYPTPERVALHVLDALGAPIVRAKPRAVIQQAMHALTLSRTTVVILDDFDPTVGMAADLIAGLIGMFHPEPQVVRAREVTKAEQWAQSGGGSMFDARAEAPSWGTIIDPPGMRALILGVKQDTWNELAADTSSARWLAERAGIDRPGRVMPHGPIGDHALLASLTHGSASTLIGEHVPAKARQPVIPLTDIVGWQTPIVPQYHALVDGQSHLRVPRFATKIWRLSLPSWCNGPDATRFLATAWEKIVADSATGAECPAGDVEDVSYGAISSVAAQARSVSAEITGAVCHLTDGRLGEMLDLLRHVHRYAVRAGVKRNTDLSLALVAHVLASEPWVRPAVRECT